MKDKAVYSNHGNHVSYIHLDLLDRHKHSENRCNHLLNRLHLHFEDAKELKKKK